MRTSKNVYKKEAIRDGLIQTNSSNYWIGLAAIVFLLINFNSLFLSSSFYDSDAARIVISSYGWSSSGKVPIGTYVTRVSPMYMLLIKSYFDFLPFTASKIPLFLGVCTNFFSALNLCLLFYLLGKLFDQKIALISCVLYATSYSFIESAIICISHVEAMFFLLLSVIFLYDYLLKGQSYKLILTFVFACIAVSFKANIILCFGLFWAILILTDEFNIKNAIITVLVGIAALLFTIAFSSLIPIVDGSSISAKTWSERFPIDFSALNYLNNTRTIYGIGLWNLILITISIAYLLIKGQKKYILSGMLISLPQIAFWALRPGNQFKHITMAVVGLIVFPGIAMRIMKIKFAYQIIFVTCIAVMSMIFQPSIDASKKNYGILKMNIAKCKEVERSNSTVKNIFNMQNGETISVKRKQIPFIIWSHLKSAANFKISWGNDAGLNAWADNLSIEFQNEKGQIEEINSFLPSLSDDTKLTEQCKERDRLVYIRKKIKKSASVINND